MAESVVSRDAEITIRLLMLTAAQHFHQEALLAATPQPRGRLRTLPTSSASHQARSQSTLLRLTSITEAHVAGQLVQRVEPHFPTPRTAIIDDIYVDAEDKAIGSWPAMIGAYKRWFGINLKSYDNWNSIQAMLDARNAVAHGVGELTRRQARKDLTQLGRLLAEIDISVDGTRLEVPDEAIRSASSAARRFVVWLDDQLSGALSTSLEVLGPSAFESVIIRPMNTEMEGLRAI